MKLVQKIKLKVIHNVILSISEGYNYYKVTSFAYLEESFAYILQSPPVGGSFRMTLITLHLLLFTYLFPFSLSPVYAQASPSSSLRSKIEELKSQIASKATEIKKDLNSKLQNKFYIGVVESKQDFKINIIDREKTKVININEYTIYQRKNSSLKKTLTLKDIQKGDFIAGLGDIDEAGNLTAKKVIFLPTYQNLKKIFWGEISFVSPQKISLKLKNNQTQDFRINQNSLIYIDKEEVNISKMTKGDQAIVVGRENTTSYDLSTIYIIKKFSPTPKATSSATLN